MNKIKKHLFQMQHTKNCCQNQTQYICQMHNIQHQYKIYLHRNHSKLNKQPLYKYKKAVSRISTQHASHITSRISIDLLTQEPATAWHKVLTEKIESDISDVFQNVSKFFKIFQNFQNFLIIPITGRFQLTRQNLCRLFNSRTGCINAKRLC